MFQCNLFLFTDRKLAIFLQQWFKRFKMLGYFTQYLLMLLIVVFLQKQNIVPTMVQLKEKWKETKKLDDATDWLQDFTYDFTLEDLGLLEMEDYKV